jgi:hypothetical protein
MSADELKRIGAIVANRGLIVLLLIQFFILRSPPEEDRQTNGFITETRKRLTVEREPLRDALDKADKCLGQVSPTGSIRDVYLTGAEFDPHRDCPDSIHSAWNRPALEKAVSALKAERAQVFDRLTKVDVDSINLTKARLRREFKIPGTDSAIDEADVRRYYPAAIAVFLSLLLGFRRATLTVAIRERSPFAPPYWIAPFPYPNPMPFGIYVALNTLGLTLFGSLGYLYFRFMFHDEVFQSLTVFAVNVGAGWVALGLVLDAIIGTGSQLARP